jgi:hypothetical protein
MALDWAVAVGRVDGVDEVLRVTAADREGGRRGPILQRFQPGAHNEEFGDAPGAAPGCEQAAPAERG